MAWEVRAHLDEIGERRTVRIGQSLREKSCGLLEVTPRQRMRGIEVPLEEALQERIVKLAIARFLRRNDGAD